MGKLAAALPALGPIASFLGPVGQIVSAVSTAQSVLGGNKQKSAPAPTAAQAPAFKPEKPEPVARPNELGGFADYTPIQERAAIATKGTQTGLGKSESDYYKNLLQRTLIGDNNEVVGDTNTLLPVESQYFSKQGINTSDIMEFLKQLRG